MQIVCNCGVAAGCTTWRHDVQWLVSIRERHSCQKRIPAHSKNGAAQWCIKQNVVWTDTEIHTLHNSHNSTVEPKEPWNPATSGVVEPKDPVWKLWNQFEPKEPVRKLWNEWRGWTQGTCLEPVEPVAWLLFVKGIPVKNASPPIPKMVRHNGALSKK